MHMTTHPTPLILASGSPRRKMLMSDAGYEFTIIVPSDTAECGICTRETPPEMVARLARQKAEDVAVRLPSGLILACDTMVECQGVALGKPHNESHARQMLQRLRGQRHRVYSGVCLWERPTDRTLVRVDQTTLQMHDVSDAAIEAHLATGDWEGKAGAFGFQDGLDWLTLVEGSESNVVGLPMELLEQMLADFG